MFFFPLALLSLLLGLGPSSFGLVGADVCNWTEDADNHAYPPLYQEFRGDKCPAPFHFQPGTLDCQFQLDPDYPDFSTDHKCDSFCQVRTTFRLGREQPFLSNPYCKKGLVSCHISNGTKQTYTWPKTPGGKIRVFDKGIDGGYHGWFDGVAAAPDRAVAPDPDGCGYFTFIPVVKEVCGTETEGYWTEEPKDNNPPDCSRKFWSTQNACVSELQKGRASDAWYTGEVVRGVTVFVRTLCANRAPAPAVEQVGGYVMKGVAMGSIDYAAYVSFWAQLERSNSLAIDPTKSQCDSSADSPFSIDCADVLEILLDQGGNLVDLSTAGNVGNYTTLATLFTCAVRVVTAESIPTGKQCNINYIEVVAAAQKVMDKCATSATVGGIHPIRDKGDCACFDSLEFSGLRDDADADADHSLSASSKWKAMMGDDG